MCLKWDFFGIEWNCATICKQLQIRTISENIFSLILMVYRHRKLGSPHRVYYWQTGKPGMDDSFTSNNADAVRFPVYIQKGAWQIAPIR